MNRGATKNFLLVVGTLFLTVVLIEILSRPFVEPCDQCYGIFFGRELPPFTLFQKASDENGLDSSRWHNHLIVNGKKITKGDLGGIKEKDDLLGFRPKKNARSENGWWQSNNMGARSRYDTKERCKPGTKRIIVFGDSFAQCDGVRQEEAWPFLLNCNRHDLEVINFGVSAYSMAQSLMRYRVLSKRVESDVVVLMFVPTADLWRDINTYRYLRGWTSSQILPRFILDGEHLKLIRFPHSSTDALGNDGYYGVNDEIREHLRAYDRLYFRTKYESFPILGQSILYKLIARKYYGNQTTRLLAGLMEPKSEALSVSKKIFQVMDKETRRRGGRFVLILLPYITDLENYKGNPRYKKKWDEMVTAIQKMNVSLLDTREGLMDWRQELDRGYDGKHYGPKANKIVADTIWQGLKRLKMI